MEHWRAGEPERLGLSRVALEQRGYVGVVRLQVGVEPSHVNSGGSTAAQARAVDRLAGYAHHRDVRLAVLPWYFAASASRAPATDASVRSGQSL